MDIIFSYLYIAGYLTQDHNSDYSDGDDIRLKLSNEEIKYYFRNKIIQYYKILYWFELTLLEKVANILGNIFEKNIF